MKRLLLPALLLVVLATMGGCAIMGPDDREFFGRGWVNPKELDTPEGARHTPPGATPPVTSTAEGTLPPEPNAWDVPGGMPR